MCTSKLVEMIKTPNSLFCSILTLQFSLQTLPMMSWCIKRHFMTVECERKIFLPHWNGIISLSCRGHDDCLTFVIRMSEKFPWCNKTTRNASPQVHVTIKMFFLYWNVLCYVHLVTGNHHTWLEFLSSK